MYKSITLFIILVTSSIMITGIAEAQHKLVGGPCEGCEAVFEYEDRQLTPTDTLPGFDKYEPKIKVTGTIYQPDGVTPAEGVILYVYHTNLEGEYETRGNEKGWARRHGYIRGWVKTGKDGRYTFYTFKPGTYSGHAAHIHPTILEPNGKYYWLGSYLFSDDPNLSDRQRNQDNPRGGHSGIITLEKQGDLLVGNRNIVLGKNISGY